jgi:hypothetical protein
MSEDFKFPYPFIESLLLTTSFKDVLNLLSINRANQAERNMLIIKKIVNIRSNNEVILNSVIFHSSFKDILDKNISNLVEKILFIYKVLPGLSLHDEKILIIDGQNYSEKNKLCFTKLSKNILHFTKLSKDNIPLGFKEIYVNVINNYLSNSIDEFATSFLQNLSEKNIKYEYNKRHNDNSRSNTESNWKSFSSFGRPEKIEEPSYIRLSTAKEYRMRPEPEKIEFYIWESTEKNKILEKMVESLEKWSNLH